MLRKSRVSREIGPGGIVPVRVRSRVVPVAVEGAIIRAIVRVTADTEHGKEQSGSPGPFASESLCFGAGVEFVLSCYVKGGCGPP